MIEDEIRLLFHLSVSCGVNAYVCTQGGGL